MADGNSLLSHRSDESLAQRTIGRFVITRRIGAGAMGTVYEARDPDLNRSVALKIVGQSGQQDSLRLLREAQALAQLQHPSVVVIHDVGAMQDGVFIAMELVDGENLRDHFAAESPSWKRALSLYLQAGRGLAAAHEKSIVHRDFKPANVLIDRQGRVRVTDFGLARFGGDGAQAHTSPPIEMVPSIVSETTEDATDDSVSAADAATALLGSPLTREGVLLGTPRYMAPEQRARRPATARSDQYSFCVCVWEVVFGVHPFPNGQDAVTVASRSARRAPRWLVRILERGLSFDPARRHPSMSALLDALEHAPRIRRRAWIAAGAAAALGVAAVVSLQARSMADPCDDVAPLQAWTPEARVATRAAFLATGMPFAADVHDTVSERLDHYASRWRAMKVETCRARVAGTQTAALLERQNACLERRQDEVGAAIAAMRVIPRDRVEKAVQAMDTLGDLGACADTEALARVAPLPQDPIRAQSVRLLEREIAAGEAQQRLGRPAAAKRIEELVERARALEYRPALVKALGLKVGLASSTDRWQDLVTFAHDALIAAEAAGDDRARFDLFIVLLQTHSTRLQRYEEGAQAGRLAEAILQRFGDDPALAAKLHCVQCAAEWYRGNFDDALRLSKTCEAERERVVPRDEAAVGDALARQAILLSALKRDEEALVVASRAVELLQRGLGERHPAVALALNTMGGIQKDLGRQDLAEQLHLRAIAIQEQLNEPAALAASMGGLATVFVRQKRYDEAVALYRRVAALYQQTYGANNNRVANSLDNLAKALALVGELEEAEALYLRSIAIRDANGSGSHPTQATAWRMLGRHYHKAKRYDKASEAFEHSLRILEAKYGTNDPLLVTSLIGIAEAQLDRGRPRAATPLLERALRHLDAKEVRADRVILQFLLARALWATPSERTRARTLAQAALQQARADQDDEDLPLIEAWLETHVAP